MDSSGVSDLPLPVLEGEKEPDASSLGTVPMAPPDPAQFLNRELSWLAFNARVLEEARDPSLPLYERLKFLGIVSTNLDEFFMVRVAGLKQQLQMGVEEPPADGMLPAAQLEAITARVHAMVSEQYALTGALQPELAAAGVAIVRPADFDPDQKQAARSHFASQVFPALTPLAVGPGHPFPHLRNKSLNIAMRVCRQERRRRAREGMLAVVQVPAMLQRLVPLPAKSGLAFALVEDLVAAFAGDLFPGHTVRAGETASFRVTRNWDLHIDEEDSEDLVDTIQEELRRRDRGAAVRLEIAAHAPAALVEELTAALGLQGTDVYRIDGPLHLWDLMALAEADPRPELRVEPLSAVVPSSLREVDSILDAVGAEDVLLHHPYESFDPVVRFIEEAADDPDVLAIKQTLYRTSGNSPFVRALSRAAENGKAVTALVEIKARFDEANNIAWARRLEENGVHVVYGVPGLKTHCKMSLVVRREGGRIRRLVHLGTGNYNPNTARAYTDVSLLTASDALADDVSGLFNLLTGYSDPLPWKCMAVAPDGLQSRVVELIDREIHRVREGGEGRIVAKMNSLSEPEVIRALYRASQAGVRVELIVRGICCLRPGVPGLSENIRVVSIVDRFLEHSRVFAFGTGEKAEVYCASADWMHRNFHRRIEVMFPVTAPSAKARLLDEALGIALEDNVKARELQPDGTYAFVHHPGARVHSQADILKRVRRGQAPSEKILRLVGR